MSSIKTQDLHNLTDEISAGSKAIYINNSSGFFLSDKTADSRTEYSGPVSLLFEKPVQFAQASTYTYAQGSSKTSGGKIADVAQEQVGKQGNEFILVGTEGQEIKCCEKGLWCYTFLKYCAGLAGIEEEFESQVISGSFKKITGGTDLEYGDILHIDTGLMKEHMGIVISFEHPEIITVEGNVPGTEPYAKGYIPINENKVCIVKYKYVDYYILSLYKKYSRVGYKESESEEFKEPPKNQDSGNDMRVFPWEYLRLE